MRLPIPLVVLGAFGSELLQFVISPLRFSIFLITRKSWKKKVREALAAPTPTPDPGAWAGTFKPPTGDRQPHLLISCGETSGELHASNFLDSLRALCEESDDAVKPHVSGLGGQILRDHDVEVRYPLAEHAVFGLKGVFQSLPFLGKALATYVRILRDDRPDVVVLFDYPGLHLVFARAARRLGIPVLHVVAPQHWAWGPWRTRRYRKVVDVCLAILPFEPAWFEQSGMRSAYIGHPLLDEVAEATDEQTTEVSDGDTRPVLGLLPGSRRVEVEIHLGPMLQIAKDLQGESGPLRVQIPHRNPKRARQIREALAKRQDEGLDQDLDIELLEGDPGSVLSRARVVLAKSGTGSLEAALHNTPTVVCYRFVDIFGRFVINQIVMAPWFGIANLCMNREISPEIAVLEPADWAKVLGAVRGFWNDGPSRDTALEDLRLLHERLGSPGASDRTARWLLPFCRRGGRS
ncbi:MAG: lipid-A-disaccharide synthase [Planctomycetota bacterium]